MGGPCRRARRVQAQGGVTQRGGSRTLLQTLRSQQSYLVVVQRVQQTPKTQAS